MLPPNSHGACSHPTPNFLCLFLSRRSREARRRSHAEVAPADMFIKVASGVVKVVALLFQTSDIFHDFPLLLSYSLFTAASLPALPVLANTGFRKTWKNIDFNSFSAFWIFRLFSIFLRYFFLIFNDLLMIC